MNYYLIALLVVWAVCLPAVCMLASRAFDEIYQTQKRVLPSSEVLRNCNHISIVYVFCGVALGPFWVIPMLIIQRWKKKNKAHEAI